MKVLIITVVLTLAGCMPLSLDGNPDAREPILERFWSDDGKGNYAFGYNEDHSGGGTFRREIGDKSGAKKGSYGIRDENGNLRIVSYVADHRGYQVDIQSNEPGVADLDPASSTINKGGVLSVSKNSDMHQIHGHYIFTHGQSMHPACCIILRRYLQAAMNAIHKI